MDTVIWIAGTLVSLYTLLEVTGLMLRSGRNGRHQRAFRVANFRTSVQTPNGAPFTIDLEPVSGHQANYFG